MSSIDATAGVANTAIARGSEPRVIARFTAYSPVTTTGVSPSWGSNGNAAAGSSSGGRVGPGGVTLSSLGRDLVTAALLRDVLLDRSDDPYGSARLRDGLPSVRPLWLCKTGKTPA